MCFVGRVCRRGIEAILGLCCIDRSYTFRGGGCIPFNIEEKRSAF